MKILRKLNHLNTFLYIMSTLTRSFLVFSLGMCIACDHSTYSEKGFQRLVDEFEIVETYKGDHSTLYLIYEDHGFADRAYYLYKHDHSASYHKIGEQSKYYPGQIWQGYILQTCIYTGKAIDSVRWIRISRKLMQDGQEDVSLIREPAIPEAYLPAKLPKQMLYRWENQALIKQGTLAEFCSLEELQEGLYLLTPPSIFYSELYDLDEIEIP